jgi:hypothetical protein
MTKKEKIYYFISYIILTMAILFALVVIFWMTYSYKTVVFNDKAFPIHNTKVKQGEMVYYTADYCKYGNFSATVTRSFINSLIYVAPSIITNRPTGCNSLVFGVIIPKELPIGEYYMEQIYKIQVNPIRAVVIKQNSGKFEVIQ